MAAILTAGIASGGTVLAAAVAGTAGYLGARRGARAALESGRAERMWENRVSLYEELAAWVRERREINDHRCPARLRGETVQLEPHEAQEAEGFPRAGQLQVWASPKVRKLHYDFTWWNDWIYLNILALQDPQGKGRYIVPNRDNLEETYINAIKTGDQLIERIRAELSGHVR